MSDNEKGPAGGGYSARYTIRRLFEHQNSILIVVLIGLIAIFSGMTRGAALSRTNVLNILLQSSIRGIASVGQAFVVLSSGIDVSVGGIGLLCSMLGASLMTSQPLGGIVGHPVPLYLGILVMLLVGAGCGTINGLACSRLGMPPLIVTLSMWQILSGGAFLIGNGCSFGSLPDNLAFFGNATILGFPVPAIIFILVAVVGYLALKYTTFGISVYAVGGNPITAWLSGTKVRNITFWVYVISGLLAGLAAIIFTARTMAASMRSLQGLELDTIAAVFVGGVSMKGGKGSMIGVVVGVLLLGVLNNGMSLLGAGQAVQAIVKGLIIFTAVAVDFLRGREAGVT